VKQDELGKVDRHAVCIQNDNTKTLCFFWYRAL